MGAGDWAPDDRRETKIAGGVFALLLAVAVMASAALGYCSVWRHARPGPLNGGWARDPQKCARKRPRGAARVRAASLATQCTGELLRGRDGPR